MINFIVEFPLKTEKYQEVILNKRFENFYRLHNLEVDRLTGKKNLSSIAI